MDQAANGRFFLMIALSFAVAIILIVAFAVIATAAHVAAI
jgi:hypothetical protein